MAGVTVERHGAAAVVTLRWPERRNAMGPDDGAALTSAIADVDLDGVSSLILTGEGAFCAGGDLATFARVSAEADGDQMVSVVYGKMQSVVRALRNCPVPTIAAVDGPAIGLGLDYAIACDMRLIGPEGWLQQGWAKAGLVPGMGGIGLLQRLNPTVMWRMVATQERLDGPRCEDLGLGEAVTPTALEAAIARTEQLARVPVDVLEHYVSLSRDHGWPTDAHFERTAEIQASLIGSERFRDLAARVLAATS